MKKLVALSAGALTVASAALLAPGVATVAGMGIASAEPSVASLNVVGEPYGRATQILKSQGVKYFFGGSKSGKVPQAMCIVEQQTLISGGKFRLFLDCTEEAVQAAAESQPAPAAPAAPGGTSGGGSGTPGQGTYGGPIGVPVPVG